MKFEVTKTTNAKYKGYEVVKSVAVIASKEELVGCKDLTNTILNVVKDNINLEDYDNYTFGKTMNGSFVKTFHIHLLKEVK